MKFIDKYYSEDKFRSKPSGKWCPYHLGYEEAPKEEDKCPEAVKDYSCDTCWNREMPELKSEPANANDFPGFEINDIVKLRSGRLCIVLPNNRSKDNKSICYTHKSSTEAINVSGVRCLNYCSDYTGYIYEKNGYIIIKNENYCECYLKNQCGKFETTKKDKKSHGYGIKIIEKTLEKYNGDLNIKIDNGIFKVIILLPQKEKIVVSKK